MDKRQSGLLYSSRGFVSDYITIFNVFICCHYANRSKKRFWGTNNIKNEINQLKKIRIKNRTCYRLDDIIKIKDFDFDNILLDRKSYENTLIYDISCKILIISKPLRIIFDKLDGFIRLELTAEVDI